MLDEQITKSLTDKYNYETGSRYETTEYRARKLAEAIERFLDETRPADWDERVDGKWKVNLVGHSQGAVDSRYTIALLHAGDGSPMHELVATYTSLAGIHGFVVGTGVGLIVILSGTLLGKPAPTACVRQSWGERG